MKDIKKILEEKNIKPSHQRLVILKFLMDNKIHPTADKIYEGVIKTLPTLSRTTIYNTIKLFQKNGILQAINLGDNELHYDINVTLHTHLKCRKCNDVFDIDILNPDLINKAEQQGHTIEETQVYFKGLCKKCREEV